MNKIRTMRRSQLKIIMLVFLQASACTLISQADNLESYLERIDTALAKYASDPRDKMGKIVIQSKLLDENLENALDYVVFSSSDLTTNNSAFAYTQNKDKTTIAINGNVKLSDDFHITYLRLGANATGKSSLYDFYSKNSWNNSVSANLGLIFKIRKGGQFYLNNKSALEKVNNKRKVHAYAPKLVPEQYDIENAEVLTRVRDKILDGDPSITDAEQQVLSHFPKLLKLISVKDFPQTVVYIDSISLGIQNYNKAYSDPLLVDKYIKDTVLYNFDKANDGSYGYSLWWIDINFNFGNSVYSWTFMESVGELTFGG